MVLDQLSRITPDANHESVKIRLTPEELEGLKKMVDQNDEDLLIYFEEYIEKSGPVYIESGQAYKAFRRFGKLAKDMYALSKNFKKGGGDGDKDGGHQDGESDGDDEEGEDENEEGGEDAEGEGLSNACVYWRGAQRLSPDAAACHPVTSRQDKFLVWAHSSERLLPSLLHAIRFHSRPSICVSHSVTGAKSQSHGR